MRAPRRKRQTGRRGLLRLKPLSALLAAGLGANTLSGCSEPPSQKECFELLDHYVELLIRSDSPGTPPPDRLRLQNEARTKADRDPAFAECSRRVSRRQFECAMQAQSPDGLERCLL